MNVECFMVIGWLMEERKTSPHLSSREFPDEYYRRIENIFGDAAESGWPAAEAAIRNLVGTGSCMSHFQRAGVSAPGGAELAWTTEKAPAARAITPGKSVIPGDKHYPGGINENSPAFQRRDWMGDGISPEGTADGRQVLRELWD